MDRDSGCPLAVRIGPEIKACSMRPPQSITASQFWAKLGYNNIEEVGSTLSALAQYAGNISWRANSDSGNSCSLGHPTTTTFHGRLRMSTRQTLRHNRHPLPLSEGSPKGAVPYLYP